MNLQTANAAVAEKSPSPKDLPLLRHGASVTRRDGQVAIRHLRDEVTLEGAAAQLFTKLGPLLDGKTTLDAAGTKLGEAPARLRERNERGSRTDTLNRSWPTTMLASVPTVSCFSS